MDEPHATGPVADFRSVNTLLYVQHFAACVAFYRHGIGLPVEFENAWFVEFGVTDTARLSVVDKSRTRMRDVPFSPQLLTLEVADLDAVQGALGRRGLEPGAVHRHPFGARVFYLRDPEGNRIEFWSRA